MKRLLRLQSLFAGLLLLMAERAEARQYWVSQSTPTTSSLYSVDGVSATTAWACGASGTVLRTTDGGTSWGRVSPPNSTYTYYSVEALDAGIAWVAGGDGAGGVSALFKTTDGGSSWVQQLGSNAAGTFYNAVRFTDANNGILMGDPEIGYFVVYTTTNGGATWSRVPQSSLPTPLSGEFGGANNLAVFGNTVLFGTAANVATFVPRTFRSTDRGRTWAASSTIPGLGNFLSSTALRDDAYALEIGTNGSVSRTTNSGATWSAAIPTGLTSGRSVTFPSSTAAIAVGSSATSNTYLSMDGGITWVARPSPISSSLNDVSFPTSAVGWAVGTSGAIVKWVGGNLGTARVESEPNNTASQAQLISYGDSLNASINPAGDVDYYRFTASAGDTVEIYAYNILTSRLDSYFTVYNGSGNYEGGSDRYVQGTDSRYVYLVPATGTHYVRVAELGGNFPNSAGRLEESIEERSASKANRNRVMADPTGEYRIKLSRFVSSAPFANEGWVSNILSTSAWINPIFNPNGLNTTISIQYGTTTSYGSTSTEGPFNFLYTGWFEKPLTGLSPNTTYHYRVAATNSKGTAYSSDATFITASAPQGWSVQLSGTTETLYGVSFSDALTGTAVGANGIIIRTTNGGSTWTKQTSGVSDVILLGVSFVGANTGTAVGQGGLILRTTNGGSTWTSQASGTTTILRAVHFTDANTGTIVGHLGLILRTTNGGATWLQQSSGTTESFRGISFVSANTAVAVGTTGTILRTTNAGATWVSQSSGVTTLLRGVYFVDANNGYCVGFGGVVLRTTNGGSSWTPQNTGTTDNFWGGAFSDANNGLVVGENGTMLRTTNGGSTWIRQSSGTFNFILAASAAGGAFTAVGEFGLVLRSTGTTTAPAISLSTTSLAFGSVNVGSSAQLPLTITNTGTATLTVSSVSSSSIAFSVASGGFSLGPSGSTTLTVTFTPSSATSYAGAITINHNASGGVSTVTTTGTGSSTPAPAIALSATSLAFGSVNVGSTLQRTFTVSNTGNATLNVTSITSDASVFSVSPSSFNIASGGGAQTVTVTFAPAAASSYTGTIRLTHNASGSPSSLSVTGSGSGAAAISLTPSSISFGTVSVGLSSVQSFIVNNTGSATLTVSSIVSNNSAFTVSSSSLTVATGSNQSVTVTFRPTTGTSYSGVITLTHNASGGSSSVSVTGTGSSRISSATTTLGRFSGGIPASSWVLLSVPYRLDNTAASSLSSQLSGTTPWKIYGAQGGQLVELTGAGDAFTFGRGVWFKTTAKTGSFSLTFGAGEVIGDPTYQVNLPTGWSIVGSPFHTDEATWTPVNTTPGSSGIRVYRYSHESTRWDGPLNPSSEKIKPFGGYAVWNQSGASATFTFVRGGPSTRVSEWAGNDGWHAILDVGPSSLRIGQHALASAGMDFYDYPMPPQRPEQMDEDPYLAGKLWSDVRPMQANLPLRWQIVVDPRNTQSLKLKEIEDLPTGWKLAVVGIPYLGRVDVMNGASIDVPRQINSPFTITVLAGPEDAVRLAEMPQEFSLRQNYPNPFNPSTKIRYELSKEANVVLRIFNSVGEEVTTLLNGIQQAGYYEIQWEARDRNGAGLTSGVYFCRLEADGLVQSSKMLLLK